MSARGSEKERPKRFRQTKIFNYDDQLGQKIQTLPLRKARTRTTLSASKVKQLATDAQSPMTDADIVLPWRPTEEAGYELEVRRQSPNALLTDEGVSNVARTLRSSGRGADTLLGEDDVASLSTLDSCRHGSRSMDAFARPYEFIRALPHLESMPHPFARLPMKTRCTPEATLVVDLDETLVHCSVQRPDRFDFSCSFTYSDQTHHVYVQVRPFAREFLSELSKHFEIVLFTGSERSYADSVIDLLDTDKCVRHRLYRGDCVHIEDCYVKDLRVLGRDMAKTAVVDNNIANFGYQLDNGVPVHIWTGDINDTELRNLIPFLVELKASDDYREKLRARYRLTSNIFGTM